MRSRVEQTACLGSFLAVDDASGFCDRALCDGSWLSRYRAAAAEERPASNDSKVADLNASVEGAALGS